MPLFVLVALTWTVSYGANLPQAPFCEQKCQTFYRRGQVCICDADNPGQATHCFGFMIDGDTDEFCQRYTRVTPTPQTPAPTHPNADCDSSVVQSCAWWLEWDKSATCEYLKSNGLDCDACCPDPTPSPTLSPTPMPTRFPTRIPTSVPTRIPTSVPTRIPTSVPTATPTLDPTPKPTRFPTRIPTSVPTRIPTSVPTATPTPSPTPRPTLDPTQKPTRFPTSTPTSIPTASPTLPPSFTPTPQPVVSPTPAPTSPPPYTLTCGIDQCESDDLKLTEAECAEYGTSPGKYYEGEKDRDSMPIGCLEQTNQSGRVRWNNPETGQPHSKERWCLLCKREVTDTADRRPGRRLEAGDFMTADPELGK